MDDYPEYHNDLRSRAVLRRAFWRKIEIEYEQSLTELMDDKLDPFHYMKWEDFITYQKSERTGMSDISRSKALTKIASPTVAKMHQDKSFDPMKMEYRISLLNRKY